MSDFELITRSHHFVLRNPTARGKAVIEKFAMRYIHWGMVRERGRYLKKPLKVFAAATNNKREYRFHINTFKDFLDHLAQNFITPNLYTRIDQPPPIIEEVIIRVNDNLVARDYQENAIEYINKPHDPPPAFPLVRRAPAKLVALQTGKGKSFTAMTAHSRAKIRFTMISKAGYLEKWEGDIKKTYELDDDEVYTIRGAASLQGLIAQLKEGRFPGKAILISNKTIQIWLKAYESDPQLSLDMGYDCTPDEFFELLGGGSVTTDEVHSDFHLNFKISLYTNLDRTLGLSATLISDDPFISRMYELAFPVDTRFAGPAYDRYISATALLYQFKNPGPIKCLDVTGKNYSQHVYENSIMRVPSVFKNYLELITVSLEDHYFKDRLKGDRVIIFCGSIEMCTAMTAYFQDKYTDLDVRRYVESDDYENILTADISVTTLLSAGTAVDVAQLTTVILAHAVSSSVSNIQGFGRLRNLPDGRTPKFVYLTCLDLPKQVNYHEKKAEILRDRALTFKESNYGRLL